MHNGIEASEIRYLDIAQVHSERIDPGSVIPESATFEQKRVKTDNLVTRSLDEWRKDRPNVAVVTGDQDTHAEASIRMK
jgi:hypothetical protein